MFDGIKQTWRDLRQGAPGGRFRSYHRRQAGGSKWRRILRLAGGIVVVAVGIVALPAPGPGILIVVVGAGLMARESAGVAGALDWAEVRLWRLIAWGGSAWSNAPVAAKVAIALVALATAGATLIVVYRVLVAG